MEVNNLVLEIPIILAYSVSLSLSLFNMDHVNSGIQFSLSLIVIMNLCFYFFPRSDPPNHGDSAPSLHVELTTCSQCSTCHYLLYDEQIMSGWNGDEANYKTTCPYCSSQLVASLTVTARQVRERGREGGREGGREKGGGREGEEKGGGREGEGGRERRRGREGAWEGGRRTC